MKRTQAEIVARIREVQDSDFFGAERGDLVSALNLTDAQEFIKPDHWAEWKALTEDELRSAARHYIPFAVGKAVGHRGLSASRSISHFRAWVWLLEPELFAGFEAAPYENYGVPQIKAAALALGFDEDWEVQVGLFPELEPMSNGRPCSEDCIEGCGS